MRRKTTALAVVLASLGVCAGAGAANLAAAEVIPGLDPNFGLLGIAAHPAGQAANGVRFIDTVPGPDGGVYAVGHAHVGDRTARDQAVAVARLRADGSLDPTFGVDGIAVHNIVPDRTGTAEVARGLAVQRDGKIVIAAQAASRLGGDPRDLNVFVVRFLPDGTLDTSYNSTGVREIDLSPGALNPAPGGSFRTDQAYGMAIGVDDRPVIVAAKGPTAPNADRNFAIIRLTRAGALDTTWSGDGIAEINTIGVGSPNQLENLNESPRQAIVEPNGNVVVGSYSEGSDGRAEGRVLRFLPNGTLDPSFGTAGIAAAPDFFADGSLAEVAEFYAVRRHRNGYVIGGYGAPTLSGKVDMIVARFKDNGRLDTSFGTNGKVIIGKPNQDDRARDLVTFPDGRILLAGSTEAEAGNLKAFLVQLGRDGSPTSNFGQAGQLELDFGSPIDALFGIELSLDKKSAVAVGHVGAANGGSGRVDPGDEGHAVRILPTRDTSTSAGSPSINARGSSPVSESFDGQGTAPVPGSQLCGARTTEPSC